MPYQSCTAVVLAVLVVGPTQDAAQSLLAAARASDARPYELRENNRINGAVYTRLVRVAMAARAAAERGRTLEASDLKGPLADESVYVVMRWSTEDTERARARADGRTLPLRVGIMPGVYPPTEPALVRPLWSREDLSLLREFGASPPFGDAAILAAFPKEALKAGSFLMAYMQQQEEPLHVGPYSSVRGALITQADAAAWR